MSLRAVQSAERELPDLNGQKKLAVSSRNFDAAQSVSEKIKEVTAKKEARLSQGRCSAICCPAPLTLIGGACVQSESGQARLLPVRSLTVPANARFKTVERGQEDRYLDSSTSTKGRLSGSNSAFCYKQASEAKKIDIGAEIAAKEASNAETNQKFQAMTGGAPFDSRSFVQIGTLNSDAAVATLRTHWPARCVLDRPQTRSKPRRPRWRRTSTRRPARRSASSRACWSSPAARRSYRPSWTWPPRPRPTSPAGAYSCNPYG